MRSLPLPYQQGAALIVALVLMTLITIIGVSANQLITGSGYSTGNFVDREQAFHDTEASLIEAEERLLAASWSGLAADETGIVFNCMASTCDTAKPPDAGRGSVGWHTASSFNGNPLRSGLAPQYFLERMFEQVDNSIIEETKDASSMEYGNEMSASTNFVFYRITARSHAPDNSQGDGRSTVVLQSIVKRTF